MQDPLLAEARARQRRTLRAIPDALLANWRPSHTDAVEPVDADRSHIEIALRRAADELGQRIEPFLAPVRDLAYAETATVAIRSRLDHLSFETILAALADTRAQALDQLDRLYFDQDEAARWVHLVVWADDLADDGYREGRLD